ncbi:hypothetical protein L248_0809 [Schleiferilactobacillus shenzhenensis LY-73]|uniref:Transcobalamin-like C-terminal domain-containing protein n=1 Tax=Schleiferilactobacillus shenzhenensis LY-73 TaxID=1231336 RepID=U4TMH6_9LACO|nr:hypothetical protein L248_0809 [Schleiferilactobacillus shenzhenensis LY-73]
MVKKIVRNLLVLFGFVLLLSGCSTGASAQSQKKAPATVTVTYTLQQNKKTFAQKKIQVPKKDAVVLTGLKKGWHVKESKGFITSIAGKSQNVAKKTYWLYTVNGKMATKGASQEKVKARDRVVFNLAPTK